MITEQRITDHPESDTAFLAELDLAIGEGLERGAGSFSALAANVCGAWPVETLSVLRKRVAAGLLREEQLEELLRRNGDTRHDDWQLASVQSGPTLPQPHPLNYDWRFTEDTRDFLVASLSDLNPHSIGLLGCPSLLRPLLRRGLPSTLFDRNKALKSTLTEAEQARFHCVDLSAPLGHSFEFSVVVADPPWYVDQYAAFFARMREVLQTGGVAFVSMLPRLTRPGAGADRKVVVERAYDLGFDVQSVLPNALGYITPPFEEAALAAEGLRLPRWRRGDLYRFVKTEGAVRRASSEPQEAASIPAVWTTFAFGVESVAVRCGAGKGDQFSFVGSSLSGANVFRSVSRRSIARQYSNVWSSRNHVLTATRTDCICRLLELSSARIVRETAVAAVAAEFQLDTTSCSELVRFIEVLKECVG